MWILFHLDDLIFLLFFAVALSFMFPTLDDTILREIQNARIKLGLDLDSAVTAYQKVSQVNIISK
jgi:hypothetical protein